MSKPRTPAQLLAEIQNIGQMVIGSITKRGGKYFNLNTYRRYPTEGKKRTHVRYLLASDLAEVKKLVAAGDRFCELMEQANSLNALFTLISCQLRSTLYTQRQTRTHPTSPHSRPAMPPR